MHKRMFEEPYDSSKDVQEDFSLKIDGIPLLKKFSSLADFNNPTFYDNMIKFDGLVFVLTFEGDNVIITQNKESRFKNQDIRTKM